MDAWIDHEINGCAFADSRLRKRFYKVLQRLSQGGRGLARLTDIHLGFTLGAKIVGN